MMKMIAALISSGLLISTAHAGQVSVVNPSVIVSVTIAPTTPNMPVTLSTPTSVPLSGNYSNNGVNNATNVGVHSGSLSLISSALSDVDVSSLSQEQVVALIQKIELLLAEDNLPAHKSEILRREANRLDMLSRR